MPIPANVKSIDLENRPIGVLGDGSALGCRAVDRLAGEEQRRRWKVAIGRWGVEAMQDQFAPAIRWVSQLEDCTASLPRRAVIGSHAASDSGAVEVSRLVQSHAPEGSVSVAAALE